MVVVAPHPDDETVGVGGVMAMHAMAGDVVSAVVVTDGGASRAGGWSRADMVARRECELQSAAEILGVKHLACLRLPEGHWEAAEAERHLAPLLVDAHLIYAPSCVDYHPEHMGVARVVANLVRPRQTVRIYEVGVPLTPVLANLVADIRSVATRKASALAVFTTQMATIAPLQRLSRYRSRLYGMSAVEVYWEACAEAYVDVIAAGDWSGRACPYRGITPRPTDDPFSALAGLGARH